MGRSRFRFWSSYQTRRSRYAGDNRAGRRFSSRPGDGRCGGSEPPPTANRSIRLPVARKAQSGGPRYRSRSMRLAHTRVPQLPEALPALSGSRHILRVYLYQITARYCELMPTGRGDEEATCQLANVMAFPLQMERSRDGSPAFPRVVTPGKFSHGPRSDRRIRERDQGLGKGGYRQVGMTCCCPFVNAARKCRHSARKGNAGCSKL